MHSLDRLEAYLKRIEARLRLDTATRGAALLAIAALTATIAVVLYTNAFAFSDASLLAGRILLFLALALAAGFGLLIPLLRLNRRNAARRAERRFPEFEERLITIAEHRDRDMFLELLAADTLRVAGNAEPSRVSPGARIAAFASASAAALGVLLWLVLAGPGFLGHGASLLWAGPRAGVHPFYDIVVTPGDRMVRRGADQMVNARLVGFQSPRARLLARFRGASKWEEVNMQPEPQGNGFAFLFAGLAESNEYYVEAGGVRSKTYALSVIDLPAVKKIRVTYHYPRYLGMKDVSEDPGGDLRAVEGTEAEVAVLTDRPLHNGVLALDDGADVQLQSGGGNWSTGRVAIQKDGMYHVAAMEQGQAVRISEDFFIEAQKETPPVVRIVQPHDARVNPIEEVTVGVEAEDDFALDDVTLHYSVNGSPEKSVPLLKQKGVQKAAGSSTLYLEDFKLTPGDVVALYASARDARSTTNTDMFFIEAQPFEREYSQSQQSGGGGGGGGDQDENRISARQKEIIAATWNEIRDRGKDKATRAEDAKFLTDVQGKLRDQARSLANRMKARQIAGASQEFGDFSKDMEAAAEAMSAAADKLKVQNWKDAINPEQRALQHLLRAEATFRRIQVAFGQRGGGGGGGSRGLGRDLENLFDLELDTEKNQYETGQQMPSQAQRQKEMDEALQRLEQLARRQQELAEQQRRNQQGFQQRWQQEMLRREAEELQRQMERLQRGETSQSSQSQQSSQTGEGQSSQQSSSGQRSLRAMAGAQPNRQQQQDDPRLRQALERLQQAMRDMRNAGSPQSGQSEAEARRAAERLQEAQQLLRGLRGQESSQQLSELARSGERLAAQQQDFERRLGEMYSGRPQLGGVSRQQAEAMADEKQRMVDDLARLENGMRDASRAMAGTNRSASSKLRDALGQLQADDIRLRMKSNSENIRRGFGAAIVPREAPITAGLQQFRDQLRQAEQMAGNNSGKPGDLEKALSDVERLRSQLDRMRSGRQQGGRQPGSEQQGSQPGGQQQSGQQQGAAQQGGPQQGGQQQGGQQQGGQQQGGQQQGGQRGPGSWQQGGRLDRGGAIGGSPGRFQDGWRYGNRGDLIGTDGQPLSPPSPAELERAQRDALRDLTALRQSLRDNPDLARDVGDLIRQMQGVDPRQFPGHPELIERLLSQFLPGLEQLELQLRRKVDEKGGEARAASPEPPPPGYADAVAEYFRRLSRGK